MPASISIENLVSSLLFLSLIYGYLFLIKDVNETPVASEESCENPYALLELLEEKLKAAINIMGGADKYHQWIKETAADKVLLYNYYLFIIIARTAIKTLKKLYFFICFTIFLRRTVNL